nr:hypothetical protein [Neisseria meningitidis]
MSLSDCFKIHKDFPYGWYVEYPAFEHISASSAGNAIYAIDVLHEEAGNVFTFLWKLSGIDTFMFDVGDSSNPLLTLKSDSKLRIAYEDPDKYDEYTNCGIGNKENIIASLLNWQTNTSHEFHANIVEILSLSTQYNNLRKTELRVRSKPLISNPIYRPFNTDPVYTNLALTRLASAPNTPRESSYNALVAREHEDVLNTLKRMNPKRIEKLASMCPDVVTYSIDLKF